MRILSYDVETANGKVRGSICAIGWVLLNDSQIVDSGYSLINPHCPFDDMCIKVHGITPDAVQDAPTFAEYWESTLGNLMEKSLVIAHNAAFDMSATEQALFDCGITDPGITYIDSLPVIRRFVASKSYKLSDLAASAGYSYQAHHAGEDAMALVQVLNFVTELMAYEDIPSLLIRSRITVANTLSDTFQPKVVHVPESSSKPYKRREHCHDDVEPIDSTLAGLRICITGDIPGRERDEVERIIMLHGGKPTGAVSGKTDYLVVGVYEGYSEGYISGKTRKAMELSDQGHKVKIIAPEDLEALIQGKPLG